MLIWVALVAVTGGAATFTTIDADRDAANWALPGQYNAHEREVESPTAYAVAPPAPLVTTDPAFVQTPLIDCWR